MKTTSMIPIAYPLLGAEEQEAVIRVLSSGQLAQGEHTEIQAAIGLVQLAKLELFAEKRIANASFLTERLRGAVQTPLSRPGYRHVYQHYTIRVPANRDEWVTKLHARGVGTGVHYPTMIYQQPFYLDSISRFRILCAGRNANKKYDNTNMHLPVTEAAAKQVLSLPVHSSAQRG